MTSDQARHTDAAPAGDGHSDCDSCCSVMLVYDGGKDDPMMRKGMTAEMLRGEMVMLLGWRYGSQGQPI